jgi:hypothetical protein
MNTYQFIATKKCGKYETGTVQTIYDKDLKTAKSRVILKLDDIGFTGYDITHYRVNKGEWVKL